MTYTAQALSLNEDVLETVAAWQRAAGSLEVCGLFAVDRFGGQRVLRLTNHAGLPGAFETSRSEEQAARAAAAQWGWEIVAFLHTHPYEAPDMSPRDARGFERDTLPWIIIGSPTLVPVQRTHVRGTELSRDGLEPEWSTTE